MLQRRIFEPPHSKILIQTASKVNASEIQNKQIQSLIEDMLSVAYGKQEDRKKPVLVGLAGPQIGISKRIILVDVGADGHGKVSDLRVYINPEIIWESTEKEEWYEGCYSTDRVCGIVNRSISIKIDAYDREGNKVEEMYSGYTARIFQHEIDHLNGIEFVQHITKDGDLHWVEDKEFPLYRDKEAWRTWPNKCSRKKWEKIKNYHV